MALGYGYVKRDEPQQIDWGTIGKEMTDFIKSDQESRTKRKEEIQNQYSELTKSLIDKPVGYNTDLNDVISSYADQASIAALSNLNKLNESDIPFKFDSLKKWSGEYEIGSNQQYNRLNTLEVTRKALVNESKGDEPIWLRKQDLAPLRELYHQSRKRNKR